MAPQKSHSKYLDMNFYISAIIFLLFYNFFSFWPPVVKIMIVMHTVHLQCFCVLFICNLITTNLWPAPAPLIAWHCKSQYLLHLAGQPNTVASPCNMRPQITFPGHQVCSIKSVPSNLPLKQHPLLAHTICYTWTPL